MRPVGISLAVVLVLAAAVAPEAAAAKKSRLGVFGTINGKK